MSSAETLFLQVNQALQFLSIQKHLTQKEIQQKLQVLGYKISTSSLSNLHTQKSTIGLQLLRRITPGFDALMLRECCLKWDANQLSFVPVVDCLPQPIPIVPSTTSEETEHKEGNIMMHDGRIDVPDKVAFYQKAESEIIEFGLRLNNFSNYFENKRDSAFRQPLHQLLERGVNFKCYILDPSEGGFARKYFEDRARVQVNEKEALAQLSQSLSKLRSEFLKINKEGYPGKMHLSTYAHFPYYHASAIDLNSERGALYISPYLYGITRVNTPVIELSRRSNKVLYRKYVRSLSAMTESRYLTTIV